MAAFVDNATVDAALELRKKVDQALAMGITAETIGAVLMAEKGLDPGGIQTPAPSLDALLAGWSR